MRNMKSEMIPLIKDNGNWSLYFHPVINVVYSFSIDGNPRGDSMFGSQSYFRRWLKEELKTNPEIKDRVTDEGYRLLNGEELGKHDLPCHN